MVGVEFYIGGNWVGKETLEWEDFGGLILLVLDWSENIYNSRPLGTCVQVVLFLSSLLSLLRNGYIWYMVYVWVYVTYMHGANASRAPNQHVSIPSHTVHFSWNAYAVNTGVIHFRISHFVRIRLISSGREREGLACYGASILARYGVLLAH